MYTYKHFDKMILLNVGMQLIYWMSCFYLFKILSNEILLGTLLINCMAVHNKTVRHNCDSRLHRGFTMIHISTKTLHFFKIKLLATEFFNYFTNWYK